ncbi:MAG TPA: hypothetical protein VGO45_07740 [Bacteroidia bacterium]|nr:hypothetical protein [Bacteroidia bacterium]
MTSAKAQSDKRPEPEQHDIIITVGAASSFVGLQQISNSTSSGYYNPNGTMNAFSYPAGVVNVDWSWKERLSIGGCFSWQEIGYRFNNYNYTPSGSSIQSNPVLINWVDTYDRYNLAVRLLYQFVQTKDFQMYFGVRGGYTWWSRRSTNPDPFYNFDPYNEYSHIFITPVSIQSVMGMRYFFNETIGINAEVGIGAPYALLLGVTGKFK